jgi:hypothetical protein
MTRFAHHPATKCYFNSGYQHARSTLHARVWTLAVRKIANSDCPANSGHGVDTAKNL